MIEGHEGYEVSDEGLVRSLDRVITRSDGVTQKLKGKILTPGVLSRGHLHVVLPGRDDRTVHSLVAEAFLGPRPDGLEVRHANGVPSDNRLVNLSYGTKRQNSLDSIVHGSHFQARKTHCKHGHPLSGSNLRVSAKGYRNCVACCRDRNRRFEAKKRSK